MRKLTSVELIVVAQLGGTAQRHVHRQHGAECDQAAAVEELHTLSTDPRLLAHTAARHRPGGIDPRTVEVRHLLITAGADVELLAELDAAAPPGRGLSGLGDQQVGQAQPTDQPASAPPVPG